MNFLLHHHLALRDLGEPASGAGALLPDVWRMAERRARISRQAGGPEDGDATGRAVERGVLHHLEVDAWFHRADVFSRGERAARLALARAGDVPKLGLFAHVAWELCLDGALVRRLGVDRVVESVRASVGALGPDAHHRAGARLLRHPAPPARVDEILRAIVAGPWLRAYTTGAGIAECIDRMRGRFGLASLAREPRSELAAGLDDVARAADAALDEISAASRSRAPSR